MSRMKPRKFPVFLLSVLFCVVDCAVDVAPKDVTLVRGSSGFLQCLFTEEESASWQDSAGDGIFGGMVGGGELTRSDLAGPGTKYENFDADSPVGSLKFNLNISEAEFMEDEGTYRCVPLVGSGEGATVSIEVPPFSVSISCNSSTDCRSFNEDVSSEISCTCTAIGAYPETLGIRWTSALPSTTKPNTSASSIGPNGSFDFTQTAVGSITTGASGNVQCTLEGFVNDIEEAARTALYTYSSPICELTVTHDQECSGGSANLTCSCKEDVPKVHTYTFFKGDLVIIDDGTQDNVRVNVPTESDEETVFSCRGCNGFNFGEQSLSKVTICGPGTTTIPTTSIEPSTTVTTPIVTITNPTSTDNATTPPMKTEMTATAEVPEDSSLGLIIGLSVGVPLGLLLIAVLVYWFFIRNRGDKKGNNLAVSGGNTNPSYTEPGYGVIEKDTQPKSCCCCSTSGVASTTDNTENSEQLYPSTGKDFDPGSKAVLNNSTVKASTVDSTNSAPPVYGVVNQSTKKKKSDNTDGNGVNAKLAEEQPEYAAVNKPKSQPQAAPRPRSSQPPDNKEQMELQYADLDLDNQGRSNEIRKPADEPTEYATVHSVVV